MSVEDRLRCVAPKEGRLREAWYRGGQFSGRDKSLVIILSAVCIMLDRWSLQCIILGMASAGKPHFFE